MSLFILFVGVAYGLGLLVTIRGVATAPHGYERDHGFVPTPNPAARAAESHDGIARLESELSRVA